MKMVLITHKLWIMALAYFPIHFTYPDSTFTELIYACNHVVDPGTDQ